MYHVKVDSLNSKDPLFTKLQNGDGVLIVPDARVGKEYFSTGIYERVFIKWACETYTSPEKECVDVGAGIGLFTVELGKLAKRVHSFESSPKNYNYLCTNVLVRDLSYRVTTYPTALSDQVGDGAANKQIPVTTLDSYHLKNINFIKIEVEGCEETVLRGAVDTLRRNEHPPILFDSWPERYMDAAAREKHVSLFSFLDSIGYVVQKIRKGAGEMSLATKKNI